jgi:hypothetical protein
MKIGVVLADGTVYEKTYPKLPRYWKSVALSLAPYGANRQGCSLFLVRQ